MFSMLSNEFNFIVKNSLFLSAFLFLKVTAYISCLLITYNFTTCSILEVEQGTSGAGLNPRVGMQMKMTHIPGRNPTHDEKQKSQ